MSTCLVNWALTNCNIISIISVVCLYYIINISIFTNEGVIEIYKYMKKVLIKTSQISTCMAGFGSITLNMKRPSEAADRN